MAGSSRRKYAAVAVAAALVAALGASTAPAANGGEPDPRIINGRPAPEGAYPWMVALVKAKEPAERGQFCGGSLIGPRIVLSAAHCFTPNPELPTANPADVDAVIGRNRLDEHGDGERIDVKRVATHPEYDPRNLANDAALLLLAKAPDAAAVELPGAGDEDLFATGRSVRVMGWGLVKENGVETSWSLRETDVVVRPDEECATAYRDYAAAVDVCAAAPGTDACQGDSGGPLVAADEAAGWTQVGIVSYGTGCARPGFPGVYSDVLALRGFVTDPDPTWAAPNVKRPKVVARGSRGDRTLHCRKGRWAGPVDEFQYAWRRYRLGEHRKELGVGQDLDVGRKEKGWRIACEVYAQNEGGFTREFSRAPRLR